MSLALPVGAVITKVTGLARHEAINPLSMNVNLITPGTAAVRIGSMIAQPHQTQGDAVFTTAPIAVGPGALYDIDVSWTENNVELAFCGVIVACHF